MFPLPAGFFAVAATEGGAAVPPTVKSREKESAKCSPSGRDSWTAILP